MQIGDRIPRLRNRLDLRAQGAVSVAELPTLAELMERPLPSTAGAPSN